MLFTINSQPKFNGVKSTDPTYGWGPEKGYIYQKAYFEFLIDESLLFSLINYLDSFEDISYQIANKLGESY